MLLNSVFLVFSESIKRLIPKSTKFEPPVDFGQEAMIVKLKRCIPNFKLFEDGVGPQGCHAYSVKSQNDRGVDDDITVLWLV